MAEPCVESLISIVRSAVRLIERSTYLPSNSPALERLKEATDDVISELEQAAERVRKPKASVTRALRVGFRSNYDLRLAEGMMRSLLLTFSLLFCGFVPSAQSQDQTKGHNSFPSAGDAASEAQKSSSYLFVWAGELNVAGLKGTEGARRGTDFLAVLDADPTHGQYGKLVAMLPVGNSARMPHHTNYQMPDNGVLFANDFDLHKTFIFDLHDPQHPSIAASFTEAGTYSHPHSFAYMPNGNTLATFQQKGLDDSAPGGLVELNATGEMVRSADAADPAEQFIRPYSLQVIPALDRGVSTSTDMYLHGNSHIIQVWRLSDLKLLKTIVLPHGNYNALVGENSSEPRLLEDGRTVLVGTFNCGLYRLDGLEGTNPSASPVYDFGGRWCAVPAVAGHFWIEALQSSHSVVSLDVSDPSHPVEVGRLTLGSEDLPHWISVEPHGDRIVISGYGSLYYRLLIAKIDLKSGRLTLDEHFRDSGGANEGFNMDRQWPDGWNGPAIPHGAVFSLK